MTEMIYCRIRVQGHLQESWADWFAGLRLENLPCGETSLYGALPDQAALCGLLNRVHNLGLKVLLLVCIRSALKCGPEMAHAEAGSGSECDR